MARRIGARPGLGALALAVAVGGCADGTELLVNDTELYAASVAALNGSGVTGAAAFQVDRDGDVVAGAEILSLAEGREHALYVRAGASCPAASADVDGDGLVDEDEGVAAYGLILIPLDDDLSDPTPNAFPSGSPVEYEGAVAYATLMAHLGVPDPDPADDRVTLGGGELALGERTLVVHGGWVLDGRVVADGTPGAAYEPSLPVACGAIDRVGPSS